MSKPRKTPLHVNASHPFPLKGRCNSCGSDKLTYYQDYTNPYWYPDPKYARNRGLASFEGWVNNIQTDYQFQTYFKRNGEHWYPVHSVAFKRYNPKTSRGWGNGTPKRPRPSDMVVIVICQDCEQQTWAYMNSSVRKMPENANRKARINCPKTIYPYLSQWW